MFRGVVIRTIVGAVGPRRSAFREMLIIFFEHEGFRRSPRLEGRLHKRTGHPCFVGTLLPKTRTVLDNWSTSRYTIRRTAPLSLLATATSPAGGAEREVESDGRRTCFVFSPGETVSYEKALGWQQKLQRERIDHEGVLSRQGVTRPGTPDPCRAVGPVLTLAGPHGLAGGRRLPPGRTHPARAPHGTYPIVFQAKFCYLCCREKPGFLSRDGLPGDSVCEAASAQRSSSPIYSYRDDTTCCSTSSPMVSSFVPC